MKLVSSRDGKDAVAQHNAQAAHRPIPPRRADMPSLGNDPKLPQEMIDAVPDPDPAILATRPILEQWYRYDRKIYGGIDGQIVQLDGLAIKIQVKWVDQPWVYMDTGEYYRLGHRRYAGT